MLRVFVTNVMGRTHVSLNCYAHGSLGGHTLWSRSIATGAEGAEDELRALSEGAYLIYQSWKRGDWDFNVECLYQPCPATLLRREVSGDG